MVGGWRWGWGIEIDGWIWDGIGELGMVGDDVGGWECDWDVKGCMCAQMEMGMRMGMR